MLPRVVLLVADASLRDRLMHATEGADCLVTVGPPSDRPWDAVNTPDCDIVLVELARLPEPAAQSVARIRATPQAPVVIPVTQHDDPLVQAELLAAGASAVLHSGVPDDVLEDALSQLIESGREASSRETDPDDAHFNLGDFASRSPQMRRFMEIARRVSQSDSSVLILGETGVGKERLARAIHAEGPRADEPFVDVNCGAIPEALLESELFGHERGAFTGADRAHRGRFEMAHKGTIFLDEIGEMPVHLQVKLLRVLQDRRIQRVGAERTVPVDVRVIAATNRDPAEEISEKRFRSDLYYRLSVVTLTIPPLRERKEDIPLLVENYLQFFATQMPTVAARFGDAAMQALTEYAWPGNVRELINVVERAVLLTSDEEMTLADLPETITGGWVTREEPELVREAQQPLGELDDSFFQQPLRDAKRTWLAAFERTYLERLLRQTGGRIGETAQRAGIVPRSLHTKMRELGLRKEDFRGAADGD